MKRFTEYKNILYLSHQPYMIQTAVKLKERFGWIPVFWIVDSETCDEIGNRFPDCQLQDYIDSIKGIFPNVNEGSEIPLDESLLNHLAPYESIALNMMERNDSTNTFTYQERLMLYHRLIQKWSAVFKTTKPDLLVFEEEPHQATDYVAYALAQWMNIKTIMFIRISIIPRLFAVSVFEKGSPVILDAYAKTLQNTPNESIELDEEFNQLLHIINGNYEDAVKFQFYDQPDAIAHFSGKSKAIFARVIKGMAIIPKLLRFPFTLLNLFKEDTTSDQKKKGLSFQNSSWNKLEVYLNHRQTTLKKKRNKAFYAEHCNKNPNLQEPYILCALSYQPEKTTSPMGGHFVNQILMIRQLRKCMPANWKLYVKDHMSQYNWYARFGDQYRSEEFYQEILSLPDTELLPLDYDTFKLVDHAKAVATVAGTIAFEAVVRNKPALTFGYTWYMGCEGVLHSMNSDSLKEHIQRIQEGYKPDSRKVKLFLKCIQDDSYTGVVGGKAIQKQAGEKGTDEINSEGHVKAIQALLNYE